MAVQNLVVIVDTDIEKSFGDPLGMDIALMYIDLNNYNREV